MPTDNVYTMFPNKTRVEYDGVPITFTKQGDGSIRWEFTRTIGAVRLDGIADSIEHAEARAKELIDNFKGVGR